MEPFPADWLSIFVPESAIVEHFARGAALYFGILIIMRLMPRRSEGEPAAMDLVFIILIANAAAEAMGDYTSVAGGILLVMVFMGLNYLINLLSYHVPFFKRLVSAAPLPIVRNGQLLRRNMRCEFLTEEELMTHLRREGIEDLVEVRAAYIEGDGGITVVSTNAKAPKP